MTLQEFNLEIFDRFYAATNSLTFIDTLLFTQNKGHILKSARYETWYRSLSSRASQ
jgi:hypothetical protein